MQDAFNVKSFFKQIEDKEKEELAYATPEEPAKMSKEESSNFVKSAFQKMQSLPQEEVPQGVEEKKDTKLGSMKTLGYLLNPTTIGPMNRSNFRSWGLDAASMGGMNPAMESFNYSVNKGEDLTGGVKPTTADYARLGVDTTWAAAVPAFAAVGAVPTAVGAALLIPAFKLLERADEKARDPNWKEEKPESAGMAALEGPATFFTHLSGKELDEKQKVARDVLDTMAWMVPEATIKTLKMGAGALKGIGPQITHAAKDYPLVKAGLMELQGVVRRPSQWINTNFSVPVGAFLDFAASARIFRTTERVLNQGHSESAVVYKGLKEIFQPAIERMDKNTLQGLFRNNTVLRSKLDLWGRELGNTLALESNPLIRHEITKGLRGTSVSQLSSPEAKKIVSHFNDKLKSYGMKDVWENEFKENISKFIGSRLSSEAEIFTGKEFTQTLSPLIEKVGQAKLNKFMQKVLPKELRVGRYTFKPQERGLKVAQAKTLQKGLRDIIGDPTIPYDLQIAAKDLHNLPATLPQEVSLASRKLTEKMLTENLKRQGGVVIDKHPQRMVQEIKELLNRSDLSLTARRNLERRLENMKDKEYLPSLWFNDGRESMYVLRDVELELRAMQTIPKIANAGFNKYFMGPWKVAKVMMRPAAWARNSLTNLMQNHMGGLPFYEIGTYGKAMQGMLGSGSERWLGRSVKNHWEDWSKITGGSGTFSMDEVRILGAGMKSGMNGFERGLAMFDTVAAPARSFYQAQEQYFKFAKYLHNLKGGMGQKEAAWDAMKWTFNYGEVTRATGYIRTYGLPFFTWQSKVFPQMVEVAVKNPVKMGGAIWLYQEMQTSALEEAGMSEEEWKQFKVAMPDWLNNGLMFPLPWRDSQDRLQFLDLTYIIPGFGDAYELQGHGMAAALQHPLLSIAGGLKNNKTFSGAPIWYEWEPPSVKTMKILSYVWENIMPAPMPGGTDWNKMYQAFVETPMSEFEPTSKDFSRLQALSSASGFKINPLDVGETYNRFELDQKRREAEIRGRLNIELKKARSEGGQEKVIEKYFDYMSDSNKLLELLKEDEE